MDQGSGNKNNLNDDEKSANSEVGLGLFDFQVEELAMLRMEKVNKHISIADSEALCHLIGSLEGSVDCLKIRDSATVGNGHTVQATMIGTKKGRVKMPDGTYKSIALHGCKYVPELVQFNYFFLHEL